MSENKIPTWARKVATKKAAIPLAALLVGVGIGATTQPEPEVRTVTKTDTVTEEVEVVKEVKVSVVPVACLTAIEQAEKMGGIVASQAEVGSGYIDLIPKAFTAGFERDTVAADEVIAEMESLNKRSGDNVVAMQPIVDNFNRAKGTCREAAE